MPGNPRRLLALALVVIWTVPVLVILSTSLEGQQRSRARLRLSARESLEVGKELLEQGKYHDAHAHFVHAYEVDPNSEIGREGLLLAADAQYGKGTSRGYEEAEAAYRNYLQHYPTSRKAGYAQFQLASCLATRMEKPDREQATTVQALAEYENVIQRFPTSEYAGRAKEELERVRGNLAEHDFVVGKFYLRTGIPESAVNRFKEVLENYPGYGEKDKLLFYLARAYDQNEQPENAALTRARLREEFPDSRYARRTR